MISPTEASIAADVSLVIPHQLVVEWGRNKAESVMGAIKACYETEFGAPHEWRLLAESHYWMCVRADGVI